MKQRLSCTGTGLAALLLVSFGSGSNRTIDGLVELYVEAGEEL